jgi:hypothetical protein
MVGFIFTRNAVSDTTANYWIECYDCIRTFYPGAPILIIDSFSDPRYINSNKSLTNCTIIQSELEGAGYFASYYYFHKLQPFTKAVILHDSVFIKKFIDFDEVEDVKFLWHFPSSLKENVAVEKNMMAQFGLVDMYEDCSAWHSCFGCMSVITWEFIDSITYIFNLIPFVKNATDRMCLERVMAVIFTHKQPKLRLEPSLLGSMDYDNYVCIDMQWNQYISQYRNYDTPAIKIWTRRP